ncbi:hypothetical protein HO133_009439 [Letharia lupina]|uniref:Endo-beta-1,6-galactanase-like domain-containing protein n=1 Tax=Letharia lupina TaxID=560253 RepID=A0A8H6CN94_9LECA|nr:uncharacterized protein HO133_009439 [Letharia lupina]KAF6226573.1 hypothetical protein HO133_009439 [Letharia lupina]
MNTILYLFLAAIINAKAQTAFSATNGLPSPPASVVPSAPAPLGNTALWEQAITLDSANNITGNHANQYFYSSVAWWQSLENSSNSYFSGSPSSVDAGPHFSQLLQIIQNYPIRYDQAQASDPKQTPITIMQIPEQTIKSFGASGAWWPNDLNYFPSEQQQNLSELLFSKDWLYLSGYRYNMGASGDHDIVTVKTDDAPVNRGVESFMKTDGTYDWTRDGPGMYYLRAAEAANVSSITFFVNAAPSGLNATTASSAPCGGTLEATAIPAFVTYIETVLAYWADQGITIEYISPMNEPDDSFSSCGQEGMAVPQSIRTAVFQQLRAASSASTSAGAKAVKIMGDETSQIASQALMHYGNWLPETLTGQYIDAIAVHMYDWPDDATLLNFRQLVKNCSVSGFPPPVKMTEISSFQSASGMRSEWGWTGPSVMSAQYDPTMSSALDMARMIWQWLTLVNAESFDWWTANGSGWNDALIYIDANYRTTKDYNFYLTKRFWVFRHFTQFIRPGSVRYDIPNEVLPYGTVAVASLGTNNVWQATFINRNNTAQVVTMNLPRTGGRIQRLIQTTDDVDWGDLEWPKVASNNDISLTLPARGVLTVQFSVSGPLSGRHPEGDGGSVEYHDHHRPTQPRRWGQKGRG